MGCGVAFFFTELLGQGFLEYSAETLSKRLRIRTFKHLLNMEIGFFDEIEHSPGNLQARLSYDAFMIQAASGKALSQLVRSLGALTVGLAIALQASWHIGLIILATTPLTVAAGYYMTTGFEASELDDRKAMEMTNHIACESITAIRTVSALNLQKFMLQQFQLGSHDRYVASKGKAMRFAAICFVGIFLQHAVEALIWYVGGIFISDGSTTFAHMMQAYLAVEFAGDAMEESFYFGAQKAQALCAASSIFRILDRPSKLDAASGGGEKPSRFTGRIEFKNVTFSYPSSPDHCALRNFNLIIEPGMRVALVGASGSGKSSVLALLLRFYDPQQGAILLDGVDIRQLDVNWLRRHLGYVPQETVLFCDSIEENIKYGSSSAGRGTVRPIGCVAAGEFEQTLRTDMQIDDAPRPACAAQSFRRRARRMGLPHMTAEDAARRANAHLFIEQLPEKYKTECGDRGSQLSGGQKQRIAIARMLLRLAPVMLLDEATSAMDSESERLIQKHLDSLTDLGRSLVMIAHRLPSVKGCDKIAVMQQGQLVEEGGHESLLQSRGLYWQLAQSQQYSSQSQQE
jgi:ATP-binding cassette subfamily B (MDR/TAP) protein 1